MIGRNVNIDDMLRDGYKAIFMGTGVWQPYRLGIKGESFGNVHYAIDYLKNPDVYHLGKRLAVIGGGNTAMDVARTAFRHGCEEVTLVCRTGEEGLTARDIETSYAKIDGVRIIYHKAVAEFTDNGVILEDVEEKDGKTIVVPGSETLFSTDSAIIAIGQGPRSVIVSSTQGIDINVRGLVSVDESGHTSRKGIFASGDVVTGAKTVVEAVKVSKRTADAIDSYASGDGYWPNLSAE
jgi:glutamate synthase (NADPH/NADH) small chain